MSSRTTIHHPPSILMRDVTTHPTPHQVTSNLLERRTEITSHPPVTSRLEAPLTSRHMVTCHPLPHLTRSGELFGKLFFFNQQQQSRKRGSTLRLGMCQLRELLITGWTVLSHNYLSIIGGQFQWVNLTLTDQTPDLKTISKKVCNRIWNVFCSPIPADHILEIMLILSSSLYSTNLSCPNIPSHNMFAGHWGVEEVGGGGGQPAPVELTKYQHLSDLDLIWTSFAMKLYDWSQRPTVFFLVLTSQQPQSHDWWESFFKTTSPSLLPALVSSSVARGEN